ncbi:hypothetical protein JCM10908_003000 [Rhodotorula pacifica]|uniref:uncharacterized protein n=1 Tax=Rhodotorula pacifica TaxID=1495444 RepID=UPI00316E7F6B
MSNELENAGQAQAATPTESVKSVPPSPHSEGSRLEGDVASEDDSRTAELGEEEVSPRIIPASGLPPPVPIASTSEPSTARSPSALSHSADPSFSSASNQLNGAGDRSPRPAITSRSLSYKADDLGAWGSFTGAVGGSQARADAQRTARAASDGAVLNTGFGSAATAAFVPSNETSRAAGGTRLSSLGSDGSSNSDEQAFFREHQRRSLESTASQQLSSVRSFASPPLASARLNPGAASPFFQPPSFVSTGSNSATGTPSSSLPPLLSPTSTSPPTSSFTPSSASSSYLSTSATPIAGTGENGPPGSKGATLHLGDLDVWMDELYVRECCSMMGWDNVISIKMSRGASPTSGYCFLTFPTTIDAARALTRFNSSPPVLMPRSNRTFKLNWGTGLPGVQPRWDGEFSVFVGDLAREVGESDLMTLFTPLFPSTKSAKVMCDPSTGLSRGYGFVRFGEESDMQRALLLGANSHSGLLLHGRTIRISEASGSTATGNGLPGMLGADGINGSQNSARDRPRSRSDEAAAAQQGYFPPYANEPVSPSDSNAPQFLDNPYGTSQPTSPYSAPPFASSFSPYAATPGQGSSYSSNGATGENTHARRPPRDNPSGGRNSIPAGSVPPGGDPNNTTVFVGGLPACISEETLKSFFHHFGDITYCKIPPGKGCGFVQFVRRQDAELAIAKMNDFPIHGKSRIRLSWGRSQGDKQVEHVRKLASALGVPFDAVWRMVQGQDNSTIKQIATAVGSNGSNGSPGENGSREGGAQSVASAQAASARMDLRAVANAAGLSESEVLELVKNGANGSSNPSSNGPTPNGTHSHSSAAGPDHHARAGPESLATHSSSQPPRNGGPYSRVSPSSFGSSYAGGPHGMMPLSPPPTGASTGNSFAQHQVAHPPFAPYPPSGPSPSPYTAIRPESYLVQPPATSPYERVDFVDGGRPSPNGFASEPHYQSRAFGGVNGNGKWHDHDGNGYSMPPPIDEQFAAMNLGGDRARRGNLPPPAATAQHAFQPTAPDFFPGALASPTTSGAVAPGLSGEANWSWNGFGA